MEQDKLNLSLSEIKAGRVLSAIGMAREYAQYNNTGHWRDEIEGISGDYELMLEYMERGMYDPERGKMYDRIRTRLELCVRNIMLDRKIKSSPFFSEAFAKASGQVLEPEHFRSVLEGFVSEQAMTGLLKEEEERGKTREIYSKHVDEMSRLFHVIIVSPQWTTATGRQMAEILSSPTVDIFDAQLLVSAVTIAAINNEDEQKVAALVDIYRLSSDENIRQRAFVGWVFASAVYGIQTDAVAEMLAYDNVVRELADLQKQVMFCLNADNDNRLIQKDIMPELMKNQDLTITRFGITEKEDDPMEDILNPSAADERMEKLEATMHRMEQMQKEGSDIYFGGFSQMKRFPFFNDMANWFWPFFIEHPAVQETLDKIGKADFLSDVLTMGPFCESDKYSFMLTMRTVFERLPDNVREMLQGGYAMGNVVLDDERNSEDYIRRMYLQDLYRFFRLNKHKNDMHSPFGSEDSYLFLVNKAFDGGKLKDILPGLALFMHKRKLRNGFAAFAKRYIELETNVMSGDFLHIASIYYYEYANDTEKAMEILRRAWNDGRIDNDRMSLKMLGRISLHCGCYEMAVGCYGRLCELQPGNSKFALNHSVALMKQERYSDALGILYRLDYEHPSANTSRAMAWAMMGEGKLGQAHDIYRKLVSGEDAAPEDFLNAGYCQWIMGNTEAAVSMFVSYAKALSCEKLVSDNISKEFAKDSRMLLSNGIKSIDITLMADVVEKNLRL